MKLFVDSTVDEAVTGCLRVSEYIFSYKYGIFIDICDRQGPEMVNE